MDEERSREAFFIAETSRAVCLVRRTSAAKHSTQRHCKDVSRVVGRFSIKMLSDQYKNVHYKAHPALVREHLYIETALSRVVTGNWSLIGKMQWCIRQICWMYYKHGGFEQGWCISHPDQIVAIVFLFWIIKNNSIAIIGISTKFIWWWRVPIIKIHFGTRLKNDQQNKYLPRFSIL